MNTAICQYQGNHKKPIALSLSLSHPLRRCAVFWWTFDFIHWFNGVLLRKMLNYFTTFMGQAMRGIVAKCISKLLSSIMWNKKWRFLNWLLPLICTLSQSVGALSFIPLNDRQLVYHTNHQNQSIFLPFNVHNYCVSKPSTMELWLTIENYSTVKWQKEIKASS